MSSDEPKNKVVDPETMKTAAVEFRNKFMELTGTAFGNELLNKEFTPHQKQIAHSLLEIEISLLSDHPTDNEMKDKLREIANIYTKMFDIPVIFLKMQGQTKKMVFHCNQIVKCVEQNFDDAKQYIEQATEQPLSLWINDCVKYVETQLKDMKTPKHTQSHAHSEDSEYFQIALDLQRGLNTLSNPLPSKISNNKELTRKRNEFSKGFVQTQFNLINESTKFLADYLHELEDSGPINASKRILNQQSSNETYKSYMEQLGPWKTIARLMDEIVYQLSNCDTILKYYFYLPLNKSIHSSSKMSSEWEDFLPSSSSPSSPLSLASLQIPQSPSPLPKTPKSLKPLLINLRSRHIPKPSPTPSSAQSQQRPKLFSVSLSESHHPSKTTSSALANSENQNVTRSQKSFQQRLQKQSKEFQNILNGINECYQKFIKVEKKVWSFESGEENELLQEMKIQHVAQMIDEHILDELRKKSSDISTQMFFGSQYKEFDKEFQCFIKHVQKFKEFIIKTDNMGSESKEMKHQYDQFINERNAMCDSFTNSQKDAKQLLQWLVSIGRMMFQIVNNTYQLSAPFINIPYF